MRRRWVVLALLAMAVGAWTFHAFGVNYVTLFGQGDYKAAIPAWTGTPNPTADEKYVWDYELASKLFSSISTYKNMAFVFGSCFSGCFLNDLAFVNGQAWPHNAGNERSNLSIGCTARWDRFGLTSKSTVDPSYGWSIYPHAWNGAVDTPGFANLGDAHNTAAQTMQSFCVAQGKTQMYPQYHSNPTSMDNLTLAEQVSGEVRYAIIFNGKTNRVGYYNTAIEIYNILKTQYKLTDNQIAVLWGDGKNRATGSGTTYDTTAWSDIDAAGSQKNLWDTLADMGAAGGSYAPIGSNGRLLFYVLGHGGTDGSNSDITSTLTNFDVKNTTGLKVDDFHLRLKGITNTDISYYYLGGWGIPKSTSYDASLNVTTIKWEGSANDGDWVHFGVHLKPGALATEFEADWTVGGTSVKSVDAVAIPTQWQPQAGNETRGLISNVGSHPAIVSGIQFALVEGHLPLDEMVWDFEPVGGWLTFNHGEPVWLPPAEEGGGVESYFEVRTDDAPIDNPEARALLATRHWRAGQTLLLRYEVRMEGESEEPSYRNVTACHVIPEGREICENVYDSLLEADIEHPGGIRSGLAGSWEIFEDGRVVRLHLLEGVTFQNGERLTAEHVVRNLMEDVELLPELYRSSLLSLGIIEEAVVLDDFTLDIRLPEAQDDFIDRLAGIQGMIALQSEERGEGGYIGSGPYRLVESFESDIGEHVFFLEASESYWGGVRYEDDFLDWTEPRVRGVEFLTIAEEETRRELLMNGEVHMAVGFDPDGFGAFLDQGYTVCGEPTHYIAVRPEVEGFVCLPNLTVRFDFIERPDFIRFAVPAY